MHTISTQTESPLEKTWAAAAHLQLHGSQVQLSPHLQPFSAPISATSKDILWGAKPTTKVSMVAVASEKLMSGNILHLHNKRSKRQNHRDYSLENEYRSHFKKFQKRILLDRAIFVISRTQWRWSASDQIAIKRGTEMQRRLRNRNQHTRKRKIRFSRDHFPQNQINKKQFHATKFKGEN